jgi:preprotein translocase subunit SecE
MAKLNPAKFIREVRQESDRISWPSRKETTVYTVMALGLAASAATFFVLIDWAAGSLIRSLIGI